MMRVALPALLILACLAGSACDSSKRAAGGISEEVSKQWKSARDQYDALPDRSEVSDAAMAEVRKLFAFEYKILDIPENSSQEEMQSALDALGRERWECFDIQPLGEQLRLFCKRRPDTYLKYFSYIPGL